MQINSIIQSNHQKQINKLNTSQISVIHNVRIDWSCRMQYSCGFCPNVTLKQTNWTSFDKRRRSRKKQKKRKERKQTKLTPISSSSGASSGYAPVHNDAKFQLAHFDEFNAKAIGQFHTQTHIEHTNQQKRRDQRLMQRPPKPRCKWRPLKHCSQQHQRVPNITQTTTNAMQKTKSEKKSAITHRLGQSDSAQSRPAHRQSRVVHYRTLANPLYRCWSNTIHLDPFKNKKRQKLARNKEQRTIARRKEFHVRLVLYKKR